MSNKTYISRFNGLPEVGNIERTYIENLVTMAGGSSINTDKTYNGTYTGNTVDRKSILNDCELDIKVEAVDCVSDEIIQYLKVDDTSNPSVTLNSAMDEETTDLAAMSSGALASKDLISNLNYFEGLLIGEGKTSSFSYNILKVSYKSPCDLSALSFKVDIPETYIVCPLGIYNNVSGTSDTGAAHNTMLSVTPLSNDGTPVLISEPTLCFFQKNSGTACPASEDWSTFCYLLVLTFVPAGQATCLSGGFQTYNVKGFKNEFIASSLNLEQTELYTVFAGAGALTPELWYRLFSAQLLFSLGALLFPATMEQFGTQQQLISQLDYDSDGDVNAGDVLSIFRLLNAVTSGETLDVDRLPNVVAKPCCNDDRPEVDIPNRPRIDCEADIEIINVFCPDDYAATSNSKATDTYSKTTTVTVTPIDSKNPCGDDEEQNNDYASGNMIVDIGIRNSTTVSGVQFDLGFNKFSSAPESAFSVETNPALTSRGWETFHKVCSDRFGFDNVVRVISFQSLGTNHYPNGYNILDDEWYSSAQQADSIPPNSSAYTLVRLVIRDVPKTSCECPSKSYYIARPLDSIKSLNQEQISNPELYEVGKEWRGPVAFSQGLWWTATIRNGEPVRDGSSVPLVAEWSGIKVLNKRIVTNQELYRPMHERYGLIYYGHYSGMLSQVPDSYEDLISFYRTQIGIYVAKALYNGLDVGYNRNMSTYEYAWENSFATLLRFVNQYRLDTEQNEFTEAETREILSGFYQKGYKGFIDDANLDGKFDVADIVALYNSARMRYYGPLNKKGSDWRKSPTTDWYWALNAGGKAQQYSSGYTSSPNLTHNVFGEIVSGGSVSSQKFEDFENFQRVVPSYCQNTICTSTMSDLCPDICGNMQYETEETLKESAKSFSLIGFGQRTDIYPNSNAVLNLTFFQQPADDSYITIEDYDGKSKSYSFVSSGVTGDALIGGSIAVVKQATLLSTMQELQSAVAGSGQDISVDISVDSPLVNVKFTQGADGEAGNTPVIYGGHLKDVLTIYTNRFMGGYNYYSKLPNTYRGWHEYFWDLYKIKSSQLYRNEVKYGQAGATFVPLELRVSSDNKKLTEAMSYVSWSWTTLDFCDAYSSGGVECAKVKVLPGDGFATCEVFDAVTGAKMTPRIGAQEYNNFYQIPSHGKISILSHNFRTQGGLEKYGKNANIDNSFRSAPITMDGGKLITAKLFVTPMPEWTKSKSIKILDSYNDALGESMGIFASSAQPIGEVREIADTRSNTLVIGPRTSEFSQNYAQDSASLLTYSDYVLHAQIIDPRTVLIKYNTMRPFSYVSFNIKALKGSSEIESVTAPLFSPYDDYKGWSFSHHFHENLQQNIDGLPYVPKRYGYDGYSVVTVAPARRVTTSAGFVYGNSNPSSFSGMGDLCIIKFKEDICGALPIFGKEYICPPIGTSNILYPQTGVDTTIDEKTKDIDNKYPEGSYEDIKYAKTTSSNYETQIVFNYDSANNDDEKMKLSDENELLSWYSSPFGTEVSPWQSLVATSPTYSTENGEPRYSLFFNKSNGLSHPNGALVDKGAITKWSSYCAVKLQDTSIDDTTPMTVFVAGDTDAGAAPKLSLKFDRVSGTVFNVRAKIEDGAGNNAFNELTFTASPEDFSGWRVFSWIGDIDKSTVELYMDGKLVASDNTMSGMVPNNLNADTEALNVHIGHDGQSASATPSEPFHGRIGQIMMYAEMHDSEYRQRTEAYLAIKYDVQQNLPFEHIGYKHESIANGLSEAGYLSLNKTDNYVASARVLAGGGASSDSLRVQDLGSDRCAAAWVSKHICLDKDGQTLIATKCKKGDETQESCHSSTGNQFLTSGGGGSNQLQQGFTSGGSNDP